VSPSPELSVVVPLYDEQDNLEPLVDELTRVLRSTGVPFEVILVNDGSRDGSARKIGELAPRFPELRALHFKENRGQTAACDAGFKHARGAIVVMMDADLQNDPADIPKLLGALDGRDAAVGYRTRRRDTWLRRLSSTVANGIRNRLTRDDIIDTGCSLKAFRREAIASLTLYHGMHRFLPTLLRIEGFSVVQVPVNHRPRTAGRSKYGIWNRAPRALADLFAVRWMKKRHLDWEIERHDP
jgi:glycosyltransferase involved in cell wall biosynthesis